MTVGSNSLAFVMACDARFIDGRESLVDKQDVHDYFTVPLSLLQTELADDF